MSFWRKNIIISPEKPEFSAEERLRKVETHLCRIDAEILDLATGQSIIRDKVLRKIRVPKEEESTNSEDLYNKVLIKETNEHKINP